MKTIVTRFILAVATLCVASTAHAQFADVTGGCLSIHLSPELLAITQAQNVAAAVYTPAPYDNQLACLGAMSGVFQMATGAGALSAAGIFGVSNATNTVTAQNLELETINGKPVITGNIYVNTHFIVHAVVLHIMTANPLRAPLSAGPLILDGIQLTLSSAMAQILTNVFSVTVPPQTSAGTLSLNIGLCPL